MSPPLAPKSRSSTSSHATSKDFRTDCLLMSNIVIEKSPRALPPQPSELFAMLSHWPWPYTSIEETSINEASAFTEDQRHELLVAIDSARMTREDVLARCSGRNEAYWVAHLNHTVLQVFIDSARDGSLTSTLDELWSRGHRPARLYNPRPDMAFGLGLEETGALSQENLLALAASSTPILFNPVETDLNLVFPALVYESKSNLTDIEQAEDQAAVGVARALSLLSELSESSKIPYQHCVVALVSSGSRWRVYVAHRDLNTEKTTLVPVFKESLQIGLFLDRVRLSYILNRIMRWIKGTYRDHVADQVQHLKEPTQQSSAASSAS